MKSIILMLEQKTDDVIYMEKRIKCGGEHSGHKDNHEQKQRNGKFWVTNMRKKAKKKKKVHFLAWNSNLALGSRLKHLDS